MRRLAPFLFIALGAATLHPAVPAAAALLVGTAFGLSLGNPFAAPCSRLTPRLLQASVVGLGAGMDLESIGRVGIQGLGYTAIGIALTLVLGHLLGAWLRTDRETSILLSVGTAICGGSAIAAVAPVLRARAESVSVSLATVFLLNASALLFFPALGHFFDLSEAEFGLWSALAVHDTSSVVGTALQFGPGAVAIATPAKLARALWIIPVTFLFARLGSRDGASGAKPRRPWFILGFVLAAALVTWIPELEATGDRIAWIARRALVLTLFLIGSSLSRATLRQVGWIPLVQGVLLWACVTAGTLAAILAGWIRF